MWLDCIEKIIQAHRTSSCARTRKTSFFRPSKDKEAWVVRLVRLISKGWKKLPKINTAKLPAGEEEPIVPEWCNNFLLFITDNVPN